MTVSGEKCRIVPEIAFQGSSALVLDVKGRITVPARHRDMLATLGNGELTLTKHTEGCLLVFPRQAWFAFREKLLGLPFSSDGVRRLFLGSAVDVEIDAGARLLIPPELRTAAALTRNVMLVGMGHRLELWDAERHAAQEAKVLASALPESILGQVF